MAKNPNQRLKARAKKKAKRELRRMQQQESVDDEVQYHNEPLLPPPPPIALPDVAEGYMARRDISPPMRDTWRAEDEHRDRHSHRPREPRDRIDRYNPEPSPRRGEPDSSYRSREDPDIDSYRPTHQREHSRDSRKSYHRRHSPSPKRAPKPRHSHQNRDYPPDNRGVRPRDPSSDRAIKRRRTQSPSPTRSDRWAPAGRRGSPTRGRADPYDRRVPIDRAFSPRRDSPPRHSRANSRDLTADIDSYKPAHRRREPTPPPSRRRERRTPSPPYRSPSPRSRRPEQRPPPRQRDLSPYSARVQKTQEIAAERSVSQDRPWSRPSTAGPEEEQKSMEGTYSMRGNYSNRGNFQNRQQRPWVDTRQHHGSPPFNNQNANYHNSPQSASPQYQRGGWQGPPAHHGPVNSSPPYRQNSYPQHQPPPNPSAYHHNHQQSYPPPHHHNQPPPNRGGYGPNRGGFTNQQNQYDRRYQGQGPNNHQQNYRGRGGQYNNLQWNSGGRGRGSSQGQNFNSYPNSVQTSPAPSHHSSQDLREQPPNGQEQRRPKDAQPQEEESATGQNVQGNTPSKDSKFSFAFKSKMPPTTPAKPPSDLTTKAKQPPTKPSDDRIPPTQPRNNFKDQRHGREPPVHPDRDRPFPDRRPPPPNDRKHPPERPSHPQDHTRKDRSPPPKRLKPEPRPRPKLSADFATSESIYFRKPGNESVVGAGTYGKVFKAIHIYTRDKVALKKIRMEGERDGFPITAVREIRLLQHLRHAHVVALQEVMVEKNEAYMVFEYLSHDLTGLINHPTFKLTAAHKKDLGKQMFEGLDFLHRRGVLHRDIKAANILVSSSGQLKYADFGLARFYTKSRQLDYTNRVITIWYRPPELLLGETQYGPAVDIWSAACVFMEMFTRKAVFPGEGGELSQLEKVYNVLGTPVRSEWPRVVDLPWLELMTPTTRKPRQFETMFSTVLSEQAMELIKWCFKYDPTKRPTAEEVLAHPYFTSEEPAAKQATELEDVKGDWHEFESKAHRRSEEKKRKAEWEREREKRKRLEREAKEKGVSVEELIKIKEARDGKVDRPRDLPNLSSTAKPEDAPPPPPAMADGEGFDSDGEGSARMSVSPE